ncbi:MAG: nucleoside triphosphate pyrophosphohydrolase [Dehalococcoidia bacterium]
MKPPKEEELSDFLTLERVIAHLRGPEGCPWDRQQTPDSVKSNLLEECYEVLQTIDAKDYAKLCEELGDLMMHIVLQAQMAGEAHHFTIRDVTHSINSKLIHRHPHVFGEARVSSAHEVERNWEAQKRLEKGDKPTLEGIPKNMPALAYSQAVQRRAAWAGFEWDDLRGVMDKVEEEIREFKEAGSPKEQESELGDVLAAIVNIGRRLNIDVEGALRQANERFYRRFTRMEELCREQNISLRDISLTQKVALWEEAKRDTAS